ncbi:unnamed protein product [Penicillium glandicola]
MDLLALDHDFHNFWGCILSVTELQDRPIADALVTQYWENPVKCERNYTKILSQYIDKTFFNGTLPISFHGHVSDALSPGTVMSMLLRLAIFSQCDTPESIHAPSSLSKGQLASLLGFTELHVESPRWAVIEGAYAAGFGPLANLSAHAPFRDHATGNLGIGINLVGQSTAALVTVLSEAKQQGCIGVIVEIVSNQFNGKITTPEEFRTLCEACRETGLLLAVDETITALRCGAPFAYQRPEYQGGPKPDLVFFGKALGAQGIGINFDGLQLSRLGIQSPLRKRQAVNDWQAVVTQPLYLPVLLDALGVLEMAVAGDWIGRSQKIGRYLREKAQERAQTMRDNGKEVGNEVLGGLDSFIFVHKTVAVTFRVMGALSAGPGIGWIMAPHVAVICLDVWRLKDCGRSGVFTAAPGRGGLSILGVRPAASIAVIMRLAYSNYWNINV